MKIGKVNPMKKMIMVCFAIIFLLAVVTGCPNPTGESKSNSSATSNLDNPNAANLTSSDDVSDAPIEL